MGDAEFDLLCLSDLSAVIRGGADFSSRALVEMVGILETCLAESGQKRSAKLRRGIKKLQFLASFVFHHFELIQHLDSVVDLFAQKQELNTTEETNQKNARDHNGIV